MQTYGEYAVADLDVQLKMTKMPKWMKYSWVACIPVGILVALLVSHSLDTAPEVDKALAFAQTNSSVLTIFGSNMEVTYHSDVPSKVSLHGGGYRTGTYCFRVSGNQDSGKIITDWKSHREKSEFEVESIKRYATDGNGHQTIWKIKN